MRKGLLVLGVLAGGLLVFATVASAIVNMDAKAQLNWGTDVATLIDDLTPMPTGLTKLYVQLDDLTNIAGCELTMQWDPPGAVLSGCYEFSSGQFQTGTGTDCTYLGRESPVCAANEATDSTWTIACAFPTCNTVCDSGNIGWAMFDFSNCGGDIGGWFKLNAVKVTDCNAVIDVLNPDNFGEAVKVVGGTPVEAYTWGRIKQLYSRP